MKYIKVVNCYGCKYSRGTDEEMDFCSLKSLNSKSILESTLSDMSIIPEWCPLPDLDEWVSVKDGPPKKKGWYLSWDWANNSIAEVYFNGTAFGSSHTHWMPYPKGPEVE